MRWRQNFPESISFSQYIQDNVEEAASGVKGENSIKLYGNDLDAIQKTAYRIKQVMKTVPGITISPSLTRSVSRR